MDLHALLRNASCPCALRELPLPPGLRVLVMAPHPDDFDAIGLTLRHLHRQGHALQLAVLTAGVGGVDDGFEGAHDAAAKTALREAEQRASCAFFGLPAERVHFLRLWSDEALAVQDEERLRAWMAARPADLIFMPHGSDSNRTHRRTFEAVRAIAARLGSGAWSFLNQDAKTLDMRTDAYFAFGEEEARWKALLLRLHRSQQQRNLRTRGASFDERVLALNRRAAQDLGSDLPYAEVFELAPPAASA